MALRLGRLGIGLGVIPTQARPAPTTAPVNTVAPSITGILTSGQTLTANPGSWTGLPGPNFTYQWKRNGTNISGATGATRVANDTDVAAGASAITVEVTATNDIGSTPAASAGVTIAATLALSGTPGSATVGVPFSFTPTRVGGHASYSYALTGTLPGGLLFNTSTGAITGTPLSTGTASGLNITVTDGNGLTASLGVFSLVVSSSAPTLSAVFGRLTRAQAGAGYAVTGTSIISGANANHFQIVGGYLYPSATGVSAGLNAGPYSFVLDDSSTVAITTVADAYSCRTQAEYEAVAGLGTATLKGKTILLRGGASFEHKIKESGGTFYRADYGPGGVVLKSDDAANLATLTGGAIELTSKYLSIRQIRTERTANIKVYLAGTASFPVSNIVIDQNELLQPVKDTNNASFTGNLTQVLGTGNGSQTVFNFTMATIPLIYNGEMGGNPAPLVITAGGITATAGNGGTSGSPTVSITGTGVASGSLNVKTGVGTITFSAAPANGVALNAAYKVLGQTVWGNKYAITTNGEHYNSAITVTNNVIEYAQRGVALYSYGVNISGNKIGPYWEIGISVSYPLVGTGTDGDNATTVNDNTIFQCCSLSSDNGNPHQDSIVFSGRNTQTTDWTINSNRNRAWKGDARGDCGPIAFRDIDRSGVFPDKYFVVTAIGNVLVDCAFEGLIIECAKDCTVLNNTVLGRNTGSPHLRIPISVGGAGLGDAGNSSGLHEVRNNITENLDLGGATTYHSNNVVLGLAGVTIPYATAMVGPTWVPASLADVMSMFKFKVGGPGDLGGTYDAGAIDSGAVTFATTVPGNNGANIIAATARVPVNTVAPALSGTVTVGQTLTSTSGTWTGSPSSYAYQWERSTNGTTGWADISGATASTYLLDAADSGKYVRCGVIATNGIGASAEAFSAASAQVSAGVPVNSVAPALSGTAQVGLALTCGTGTWSNSPSSYAYQWELSSNGSTGWADISGATSSTYTPVSGDATKYVRCGVIASNGSGAGTETVSSASAQIAAATTREFSQWQFSSGSKLRRAASTALKAADGFRGTIILPEFEIPAGNGSDPRYLFSADVTDFARLEVFVNANDYLLCWLYDFSQSRFARIDSNTAVTGAKRHVAISWDTQTGDGSSGAHRQMYWRTAGTWADVTNYGEQWANTIVDYNAAIEGYQFGGGRGGVDSPHTPSPNSFGAFKSGGIIVNLNGKLDLSTTTDQDKTLAANMTADCQLGFGAAAAIALVGSVTQANDAGGLNFGDIGPFIREGTALTGVGTQTTWS